MPHTSEIFRGGSKRLLFGETYEDSAIELQAFPPGSRVFCIASSGATARDLAAAGHRVTAVDVNPAQLAYARSRAAGGAARPGAAERMLALGRQATKLVGWSDRKLAEFLNLCDPEEQLDYWDRRLDTRLWRAMIDTFLGPKILRLFYANSAVADLPSHFGARIRERLRRGWGRHANRSNPYAATLLLGTPHPEPGRALHPIQFVCAEAADFLEGCPPATFDAFALSNIGDSGASADYGYRFDEGLRHAAAPGAVVVGRSFGEPPRGRVGDLASSDRSMLWGTVCCTHID